MKIIAHPLLREKIGISGDVPLPNHQLRHELKHLYMPMFGGRLDLSKMEPLLQSKRPWYTASLSEETNAAMQSISEEFGIDETSAVFKFIQD